MNKIIRWYNNNRTRFWIIIFIVILIIAIPRALNNYIKEQKKNNVSSSNSNITTTYDNKDYSIISGEKVNKETTSKNNTIINSFIDYCNEQDVENAYNILSTNCKDVLYPSLDDFKNNYYNRVFNQKRIYEIQAWYNESDSYTYKVDLKEDILNTGKANSKAIEDYYTIVNENGENKLNINGYIKRKDINKSNENDNLKLTILSKDIYMDYEIYNIKVENKKDKTILLDSLENINTMYLQDENSLKFYSYSHEITQPELQVITTRNLRVKFNKKYTTNNKIKKIIFEDIILDYESYQKYAQNGGFYNRGKMEIEL